MAEIGYHCPIYPDATQHGDVAAFPTWNGQHQQPVWAGGSRKLFRGERWWNTSCSQWVEYGRTLTWLNWDLCTGTNWRWKKTNLGSGIFKLDRKRIRRYLLVCSRTNSKCYSECPKQLAGSRHIQNWIQKHLRTKCCKLCCGACRSMFCEELWHRDSVQGLAQELREACEEAKSINDTYCGTGLRVSISDMIIWVSESGT